jgi:carbon monoxide dehydrogenase subunit G
MKSSYVVDLAASADAVWAALTDLDAVIAALPGAALERDGDAVAGSVKTKLGAAQVTYRVTARADIGVSGRHVAVVVVTGREARGPGTIAASLTVTVRPCDDTDAAHVEVNADIDATGRGDSADGESWSSVMATLLAGVLPFAVLTPPEPAAAEARGETQAEAHVFQRHPTVAAARPADRRMIFAGVGIVLMLVVWRRRRRK